MAERKEDRRKDGEYESKAERRDERKDRKEEREKRTDGYDMRKFGGGWATEGFYDEDREGYGGSPRDVADEGRNEMTGRDRVEEESERGIPGEVERKIDSGEEMPEKVSAADAIKDRGSDTEGMLREAICPNMNDKADL